MENEEGKMKRNRGKDVSGREERGWGGGGGGRVEESAWAIPL